MPELPSFTDLQANYPDPYNDDERCSDGYINQCAIRVSISLIESGFLLTNFNDHLCSHGHARGAQALADYIYRQVKRPRIIPNNQDMEGFVSDKKGILFFKNLDGDSVDHIDIWNGAECESGEYFDSCEEIWFWNTN